MGRIGKFVNKVKRKIGQFRASLSEGDGSFVYRALKPFKPNDDQPLVPLKGYKYLRPFNKLNNGEPKNQVDTIARRHDFAYHDAFNEKDKIWGNMLERQADRTMISDLKGQTSFKDLDERIAWGLAYAGISAKMGLENVAKKIGSF